MRIWAIALISLSLAGQQPIRVKATEKQALIGYYVWTFCSATNEPQMPVALKMIDYMDKHKTKGMKYGEILLRSVGITQKMEKELMTKGIPTNPIVMGVYFVKRLDDNPDETVGEAYELELMRERQSGQIK
jgi:hypothetical protein